MTIHAAWVYVIDLSRGKLASGIEGKEGRRRAGGKVFEHPPLFVREESILMGNMLSWGEGI